MKKNIPLISLTLIGFILGYFVGTASGATSWDLFWEIFSGTFVGCYFGFAILKMEDGMVIGAALGLFILLSLDWIAGSSVDMKGKLPFMLICSYIGWAFRDYLKHNIIGGVIGGTTGFVWGLMQGHWFGKVYLSPGLFNASLFSVEMSILGMAAVSYFPKCLGRPLVTEHRQAQ